MKVLTDQKGAAVVEFAILAVLLAVFVFGIIEFGLLWLQSHYIANAAREGARVASKAEDLSDTNEQTRIADAIKDYLKGGIYRNLGDNDVNFRCCSLNPGAPGTPKFVEITVEEGGLADFNPAAAVNPPAVKIGITVQTSTFWDPILWDLLALIPGTSSEQVDAVTQTAVFVKQEN